MHFSPGFTGRYASAPSDTPDRSGRFWGRNRDDGSSITADNGNKLVLKTVSNMFGKQAGYQVSADTGELTQVKFVVQ